MTDVLVYTVNAFTDNASGGNPAGVVLDAEGLTEAQMLAIAAEVGFSETAFVFPSEVADFKVRFFTPVDEVDLCGHATIATFSTLFQHGRLKPGQYHQETKAGVLGLEIQANGTIFMTQTAPVFGEIIDLHPILESLNLSTGDLHPTLPIQIVSTGLPDILVPIGSLSSLEKMTPDFEAVSKISEQYDVVGYHVFTLETKQTGHTAHCRNLAPRFGIPEEAATGTANGALSSYLFQHQIIGELERSSLYFEQGDSMQRPSAIFAKLGLQAGRIERVEVGGRAFITGSRHVSIPAVASIN